MSVRHDPFAALRYGNYRFFLAGKLLLTIALQIQIIVASWIIYERTKDPFALGLIGLTEAIPALGLALPGGLLADRFNRKSLMLISTFLMLAASAGLVFYTAGSTLPDSIWPAYLVIFCVGIARGLYNPAQSSIWGQILPAEHYVNASVWNSSLWQVGAVVGPALGGLLYATIGPYATAWIVCLLIGITLICYGLIGYRPVISRHIQEPIVDSIRQGIRFFFQQQVLLSAVTLDLFAVLFGGAVALLPAFADQVLDTGPEGLGYLRSAPAVGAVIMAAIMAYRPPAAGAGRLMLACVAGFGICMIVFALSEHLWLSLLALLVSGMLDNVSVVIRSTILQSFTPEEMRGRVSAVNSIFVGSSNEIGAFESGLAAKFLGLVHSVVFGGCMTLAVVGATWRYAPALRKLNL